MKEILILLVSLVADYHSPVEPLKIVITDIRDGHTDSYWDEKTERWVLEVDETYITHAQKSPERVRETIFAELDKIMVVRKHGETHIAGRPRWLDN